MNVINIYTDGGFRKKYDVGAYAFTVIDNENNIIKDYKIAVSSTDSMKVTNITMEMNAVLKALKYINGVKPLENQVFYIITDSQYVQLGITDWSKKWVTNNWKTAGNKPVKNSDLWKEILDLYYVKCKNITLNIQWVRGHDGNQWNEHVDKLCNEAMDNHVIYN